jgi:Extracellular mutant protein 11
MSGLKEFVTKQQRAPSPPASAKRLDTAAAQALKFGKSNRFESAPAPIPQYRSSIAPAAGYASSQNAVRNTFPNNRFAKEQPLPYSKTFDEITLASEDFDATKSDLGFDLEENGQYGQGEEILDEGEYRAPAGQRYPHVLPQHALHHVHSQSPLIVNPEYNQSPPRTKGSGTHSRFMKSEPIHSDLQIRQGQTVDAINQQKIGAKKRNRSDEPSRENYQQHRHQGDEELEETDENDLPGPPSKERQNNFELSSDEAETPSTTPTRQRKVRLVHNSQLTMGNGYRPGYPPIDYDDEKLKDMKYSDLKAEDWDVIPNPKPFELPAELEGKALGDQIAYYADRIKTDEDAVLFFEQLPTSEWEQAGDWLIEKFADLLKQLKDKRQEKRRITEKFESEIEAREKAVRDKSDLFEKKLKEMQASGEGVLRGKMI